MHPRDRDRFDELLEAELATLPPALLAMLDEVPLIVEDRPSADLVAQLNRDIERSGEIGADADEPLLAEELCGLHSGIPLTERSIEAEGLPSQILLFREGIVNLAGGWREGPEAGGRERIAEEIRTTLLHEIGHEFGLDEDDLEALGYA